MAQSIRISDDLYALARREAKLMHRSVAQQIEHWAALGQAMEARGDFATIREVSGAHQQALEHDRVRRGKAKAKDRHVISVEWARNASLEWPKDAFAEPETE
jgi:hypothetical protein